MDIILSLFPLFFRARRKVNHELAFIHNSFVRSHFQQHINRRLDSIWLGLICIQFVRIQTARVFAKLGPHFFPFWVNRTKIIHLKGPRLSRQNGRADNNKANCNYLNEQIPSKETSMFGHYKYG